MLMENYYKENFLMRLGLNSEKNFISYFFLDHSNRDKKRKPSSEELAWKIEAEIFKKEEPKYYLPFLFYYDTTYLNKSNYQLYFQLFSEIQIFQPKDLWMIVEILEVMDEMIYEDYHRLKKELQYGIDHLITKDWNDPFLSLVIITSILREYLPQRYDKYVIIPVDDTLTKQLIMKYKKEYERNHSL